MECEIELEIERGREIYATFFLSGRRLQLILKSLRYAGKKTAIVNGITASQAVLRLLRLPKAQTNCSATSRLRSKKVWVTRLMHVLIFFIAHASV